MTEIPELTIRPARADDAPTLARMHLEFADYYIELSPADFQLPDEDGLVAFIEADVDTGPDTAFLVAELDGEPAGALWARVVEPREDARYQVNPDFAETQLYIDYVVTGAARRRHGIGTALVAAAEEWGRSLGATIALCDTYASSPVSLPFWQDRMGYRTRSVKLIKHLGR